MVQIRVTEEEKREWQKAAEGDGVSLAAWIREALKWELPVKHEGIGILRKRPAEPAFILPGDPLLRALRKREKPKVSDVRFDANAPVVKRPGLRPHKKAPKTSERIRQMREGK